MTVFGATVTGMLLAGCSPSTTAVIGVPPSSSAVNVVPVNSIEAAVNAVIASQLAQANENQSDGQPAQAQVELNELTSVNAFIRAEAFTSLKTT
ncbi:MAG: hypothetical protein ABSC35_14360, partial [Candidatus Dormibacteria bacterium]